MEAIRLKVAKQELLRALETLGVTRLKRFSSALPVWLSLTSDGDELQIAEDRGRVAALVPADGTWPPAGATVDLFLLRKAVERCEDDPITLHALSDAIMLAGKNWSVRLLLLEFGPDQTSRTPLGHSDLPLFRWAAQHSRP